MGGFCGRFCGRACGRLCGRFCWRICGRFCGTVLRYLLRRESVEGFSGQVRTGRTNQHKPSIALMSVSVSPSYSPVAEAPKFVTSPISRKVGEPGPLVFEDPSHRCNPAGSQCVDHLLAWTDKTSVTKTQCAPESTRPSRVHPTPEDRPGTATNQLASTPPPRRDVNPLLLGHLYTL